MHTGQPIPVQVVDGIAPVVLNMPAKGGEAHPHVQPGHLHARDVCIDVSKDWLLQDGHVVQVPTRESIILPEGENLIKSEERKDTKSRKGKYKRKHQPIHFYSS